MSSDIAAKHCTREDWGGIGRATQGAIYAAGAYGIVPPTPTEPAALFELARQKMTPTAWSYVAGSAGMQRTDEANQAAFKRYPIIPRMLRDVSKRSMKVELFGHSYPSPLLFCPIGVLEMVHADAERAVARAARSLGVPMILSTQGSVAMEDTTAELAGSPMWYQLYPSNNDGLMRSLVSRAELLGAHAIVVTLDTHLLGWRTRDLDLGFLPFARGQGIAQYLSDPVFMRLVNERVEKSRTGERSAAAKPTPTLAAIQTLWSQAQHYPGGALANILSAHPRAAVETFLDVFPCPGMTWSDLAKIRAATTLPIVVKGIQSVADAKLAVEHGVDGILVSNHGGRQVDGAIASLDALAKIAQALDGKVPLLFDSGVRSGADIFKALALGASAVCVGRPWLYGLAAGGEDGARSVMEGLIADLDLNMALSGVASVSELNRECLDLDAPKY